VTFLIYGDDLKELVLEHWGRVPVNKILDEAIKLYPDLTRSRLKYIASSLRTKGELKYGYLLSTKHRAWSEIDDEFLWVSAGHHTIEQIALSLGRSVNAVRIRAGRLRLPLAVKEGWQW
jgi:hypothetical protein